MPDANVEGASAEQTAVSVAAEQTKKWIMAMTKTTPEEKATKGMSSKGMAEAPKPTTEGSAAGTKRKADAISALAVSGIAAKTASKAKKKKQTTPRRDQISQLGERK